MAGIDDSPVHVLPIDVEFEGRSMTLHPSAVETERGLLLFDAGFPGTVDQLAAGLTDAGFDLSDVDTVLVTHQDGDHAGSLATVVDRVAPFVVAHEADAPVIDGREAPRGPDREGRYPPVRVDLELGGPATFDTLAGPAEVIPTPGHTPGHVSVYFPDLELLVAADALTAEDGLAGPKPEMTADLDRAMASVATLADLDVAETLCYHGGHVGAGSERIAEIAGE